MAHCLRRSQDDHRASRSPDPFDDPGLFAQDCRASGQSEAATFDGIRAEIFDAQILDDRDTVLRRREIDLGRRRYLRPGIEILHERLPPPPDLAYVIRRARKARNPCLDSMVAAIEQEISRHGGLTLIA